MQANRLIRVGSAARDSPPLSEETSDKNYPPAEAPPLGAHHAGTGRRMRRCLSWATALSLLLAVMTSLGWGADPLITEFMASNTATLADEDGTCSDWVEIYNPNASAVSLDGWYLTDTARSTPSSICLVNGKPSASFARWISGN